MANYEATKYNFDGGNLADLQLVNTGLIIPWTDSSIPSGYLECNGAAVSRSTYSDLFSVIGTTYGAGNGSTTFTLPDLQDDVPVGKSPNKALASTGGANTVQGTGNIAGNLASHTLSTPQIASHRHPQSPSVAQGSKPGGYPPGANTNTIANATSGNISNAGGGGGHSHNMSANFTGDSNSVLQPYLTVVYIIKT